MVSKNSAGDENIKEINNSDMSAKELSKAIESQAEQAGTKTTSGKKSLAKKPKEDTVKSKAKNESDGPDSQPPKTNEADHEEEDGGVAIIVKRRNSYMNKSSNQSGGDQDDNDKKVQPQSETKIKVAGSKTIEPPATAAAAEITDNSRPESTTEADKNIASNSTTVEVANNIETAEKKPVASPVSVATATNPPAAETSPKALSASSNPEPKPNDTQSQPTNQPAVTVNASTPSNLAASSPNLPADKLGKGDGNQIKQQKPTVFDTDQYHLPIKARNRRYVNSAISWTILALVFSVVGGYVMYKLEVLDLSRFGL